MVDCIKYLDSIPEDILEKAEKEVRRITQGGELQRGWKKIKRKKGMLRFEITPKYRMVVEARRLQSGPYVCMKHATFDALF